MRRILVSCGNDCKIRLLDVSTGEERGSLSHTSKLWHCTQLDENRICATGWDKCVSIWNLSEKSLDRSLQGHTGFTRDVLFHSGSGSGSPGSSAIIASSSFDQTVRVWRDEVDVVGGDEYGDAAGDGDGDGDGDEPPHGDQTISVLEGFPWSVYSLTLLPNTLPGCIFGGSSREIRCYDIEKSELIHRLKDEHTAMIQSLTQDDETDDTKGLLISGGEDELCCLWDVRSFECVNTIHQRSFVTSLFYWDPNNVVVVCTGDGGVTLWDLRKIALDTPISSFIGAQEAIWDCLEIDGRRFAIASADCTTSVYRADGKREWVSRFEGRQLGLCFVGWQPKLGMSMTASVSALTASDQKSSAYRDPLLSFFTSLDTGNSTAAIAAAAAAAAAAAGEPKSEPQVPLPVPSLGSMSPTAAGIVHPAPGPEAFTLTKAMHSRIVRLRLKNRSIHCYKLFLCESTNPEIRDLRTATYVDIPFHLPHAYSDVLHIILTSADTSVIQSNDWLIDYFMLFLALGHQKRAFLICLELHEIRDIRELWAIALQSLKRLGTGFRLVETTDADVPVATSTACAFTAAVFDELKEREEEAMAEGVVPNEEMAKMLSSHVRLGDDFKDHADFAFRRFDTPKSFAGRSHSLFRSLANFRRAPPNISLRTKLERTMFPAHIEIVVQRSSLFGTTILLDDLQDLALKGEIWVRKIAGNVVRALLEFAYASTISTHDITALIPLWMHARSQDVLERAGNQLLRLVETRLMEVCRDLLKVKQLQGALANVAHFLKDEGIRQEANKFFVEGSLFGGLPYQGYWDIVESVILKKGAAARERELSRVRRRMLKMTAENVLLRKEVNSLKEDIAQLKGIVAGLVGAATEGAQPQQDEEEEEGETKPSSVSEPEATPEPKAPKPEDPAVNKLYFF